MSDALDPLSDEARRFLKPEAKESPNPPPSPEHRTTMTLKTAPNVSVVVPAIVSMTFRLPAPLSAQLVTVASERKLHRERPFTQQDIVCEALRQWFVRNGYSEFNS